MDAVSNMVADVDASDEDIPSPTTNTSDVYTVRPWHYSLIDADYPYSDKPLLSTNGRQSKHSELHSYTQILSRRMDTVSSHFTKCSSNKGEYYTCDYKGCSHTIGKFSTKQSVVNHIRSAHFKEKNFKCRTWYAENYP